MIADIAEARRYLNKRLRFEGDESHEDIMVAYLFLREYDVKREQAAKDTLRSLSMSTSKNGPRRGRH